MYYFIPAWYDSVRPFYDTTQPWYRKKQGLSFNDTINHLRMFKATEAETQLTIFNYAPNLRYFLHEYDLYETPYWSLFDYLQDIEDVATRGLNFRDFDWPKGTSFVYTPFMVLAYVNQTLIAKVEFGNDGQLIWIDYYEESILEKRYVFDDRGFLSSILCFQDGQAYYQDYLNQRGDIQFREYLTAEDRHVQIMVYDEQRFWQEQYGSMAELVAEVAYRYFLDHDQVGDVLLVALSEHHNQIVEACRGVKDLVVSFFQERYPIELMSTDFINQSDLILVDQASTEALLKGRVHPKVLHLSLFDTRLSLGKSQRLRELIVYFQVDGMTRDDLTQSLEYIFELMSVNDDVILAIVSYEQDLSKKAELMAYVEQLLGSREEDYLKLMAEVDESYEIDDEEDEDPARVQLHFLVTELDIIDVLDSARLILDMSETPDLYTQIAGISAGIPQVNRVETEFVEHQKNGYHITSIAEIPKALAYFLEGLSHWNQSLVHSVQKIGEYTSGNLAQKVMESVVDVNND
ncbi:accessory Sec system protein Asp1 [Streptococcus sp. ZJ151]|uniref:accessory Sec system protein Asp1 n=1 Tax=Streptococcus jiangjianxini TaxID=3161189 RepID=UPI0032EDB0FF